MIPDRCLLKMVALILSLVALPGCDLTSPKACTFIDCMSTFTVDVTGAPPQTSVTVLATASDGSSKTGTCVAASGACSVSLQDFAPSTATIRLSWNSQTTEFTVRPTYQASHPNGPDCPPACLNTRVAVSIPAPWAAT